MDKMKKVPEIRFKEFEEEWVQSKLGDCFLERVERSAIGELISVTINNGVVKAADTGRADSSSADKSNYKRVEVGDIAYNSMRMWQGACGYSSYSGILSPAYTVVTPTNGVDVKFYYYLFKRTESLYQFRINSQGLTSDTWNLKYPSFSKINCMVPKEPEQKRIAELFLHIDNLISKLEQKLEKLRNIKQSLLNQMFVNVNRGGYAPLIRFEGYGEKWQRFALGDLVSIRAGQSPSFFNKGNVPYVKVDDLNNSYWLQINTNYRVAKNDRATLIAKNSIVFPKRGAAILTNKIRVLGENAYIDTNMMALEVSKEISSNFLGFNIESCGLFRIADTSTIPQINNKHIEPYIVYVPKTQEQESIEQTFVLLNEILEKSSFKLTKLRTMKQSLLQKMFV